MNDSPPLLALFSPFKGPIAITFGLLGLENVIGVLTPLMLGLAIDGLLGGRLDPALWLAALLVSGTVIGTARRVYDTRCYGRIYSTLASDNAEAGWRAGLPLSALSARTQQIREMVDFVEHELVDMFNATIGVSGALIMLALADLRLLGAALAAAALTALLFALSGRRIYRLNRGLNDGLDRQVERLKEESPARLRSHFAGVVRWSVRLSDLEARNFALTDILMIALVVFSLWVATTGGEPTPGTVFAIIVYVLEFIDGSYQLPMAYQQFIRLREIATRLSLPTTEKDPTS